MNQHDILKTVVANVSKEQTDMSYKGELQTLTKLSMRRQVCPSETWPTIISDSIITMLLSRGRSMHNLLVAPARTFQHTTCQIKSRCTIY